MNIAQRISRLGTETAFEVLVKARKLEAEGRDIVHLEIGEPDFDTQDNIITAEKMSLIMDSPTTGHRTGCRRQGKQWLNVSSAPAQEWPVRRMKLSSPQVQSLSCFTQ